MSQQDLKKRRNGYMSQVMHLLKQFGIEEGVRRIVERGAQLEEVNKQLEKEIADQKRVEGELRKLVLSDDLTGLYNRRGFLTLAEQQIRLARRMRSSMALVYVDVDGLKDINDTYGHDEGSAVLRYTADILRSTFRDSDIMARIGGDEFIIFVIQTSAGGSKSITNRLQHEVANYNAQRTRPYDLSLSAGVAFLDPKGRVSIEELVAKADYEMYRQKRRKKCAASTTTDERSITRLMVA